MRDNRFPYEMRLRMSYGGPVGMDPLYLASLVSLPTHWWSETDRQAVFAGVAGCRITTWHKRARDRWLPRL